MKKSALLLNGFFLFIIFFYLPPYIFAQKQIPLFTYEQCLEQEQQKKKIKEALMAHRFDESLALSEQLNCVSLSCNEKYELMALSYLGMENNKKGEKYLLLSIENGADIQKLKYNILGIELPITQEKIVEAHKKYIQKIDMELRRQLFDGYYEKRLPMMLDSLIAIGKWPGLQQIGHQLRCNKEIPQIMHYQVLLETADNEKFIEYYNFFVAECEQYNESWNEVKNHVKMRMEGQLLNNRVAPLDLIYLTPDNNLDVQQSLLQLIAIAEIAKQARFFITLHCTDFISQEIWEQLIPQFKNELEKLKRDDILIVYDSAISENLPANSLFYLTTK